MYCFIIPLNEEIYNSVTNQQQVVKFHKSNKIKHQLQNYFPNYNVEKTIFAFQTPKLNASKCSFNFCQNVSSIEEFLPVDFVTNYSSFIDLPLFKIDNTTSVITRLDRMTEQDKLLQMFIYKQQLENPKSPILYLMQYKTMTGYKEKINSIKYKYWKSKRNNCCFENLIFINGYIWAFLNHDDCTSPNSVMLENLIHCWFNK